MRIKKFILLLSLCAMLSSCGGNSSGNGTSSGNISDTGQIISENTETASEIPSETRISETPAPHTEASTLSDTGSSEENDIPGTETSEIRETASETSAQVSETEIPDVPQTTAPTAAETTTTATTTAAPKPPAEVVIPKINMPKADGSSVISGDNAEIDYSNAAEGYISAVYNGSAAAAKIRIQCGDTQYNHDLSVGGKREFFPLMDSGSYTVSVYEQFSGNKYAMLISGDFSVNIKSSTGMYLYPNKYVDFDSNSKCVRKAAELCAGLTDDVEKIAAIFTFITDNVTYDKQLAATVQSGYVPYPDNTLASKKGICYDYSSLFAAMCRSQGIPARLVIGYAEPDIYHAWNEVYTDETGWITPELFLKNKGYNIADATFYAGNSDKEKISEYISDSGNYSAVYRY